MKTKRTYKVVKTDVPNFLKFVCVDSPKAAPIYLMRGDFPKGKSPKIGESLRFKRHTNFYSTWWAPVSK